MIILENIDFELLVEELRNVEVIDGPLTENHLVSIIRRWFPDEEWQYQWQAVYYINEILEELGICVHLEGVLLF